MNGDELDPERLLALGLPLEGHADNLAAALAGGVCLTWDGRIARIADSLPCTPDRRRAGVARADGGGARLAARARDASRRGSDGRARGAARSRDRRAGSPTLFAASLHDELHEPYRAATAPAFEAVRDDLPPGAVGVTISGSGPTVIVWAEHDRADECARALEERFGDATVLQLRVSASGVERA